MCVHVLVCVGGVLQIYPLIDEYIIYLGFFEDYATISI